MAVRVIKKSLAGSEDLLLGFGTEVQVRNDKNIEITKINASNIPYDKNKSISASITKKLDTLADMRAMSELPETVWCSGYHSKNDGAFGSHFFRSKGLKTTETDNSGTIIIVSVGGSDYAYELQYSGAVNVKWFGAKGDGVTDDTTAIRSAFNSLGEILDTNYPTKRGSFIFPNGRYLLTTVSVPKYTDISFDGAILSPFNTSTQENFLLYIRGFTTITNLVIDMNFALNYGRAVYIRGRYNTLTNPIIWRATLCYTVGSPEWINPSLSNLGDSENIFNGGECNWCLNVIETYGRNTIIHLTGGIKLYSYKFVASAPVEWASKPEWIINNFGAAIYISNSFLGSFSGATAAIRANLVESNDITKNSYGSVIISNTHIETGYLYACINTANKSAYNASVIALSLTQCQGYVSGGGSYYIRGVGLTFQPIIVTDCNFYGNQISTYAIEAVSMPVKYDIKDFVGAGRGAFSVRTPYKTKNSLLLAANTSNTLLSSLTNIVFTLHDSVDYATMHSASWYNQANGGFIASTALYNVEVTISISLSATPTLGTQLGIYSAATTIANGSYIESKEKYIRHTFYIPYVAKGNTLTPRAKSLDGLSLDGSVNNTLTITANT